MRKSPQWSKSRVGGTIVFVTGLLCKLDLFERFVSWLSGAVFDDTSETIQNMIEVLGSPMLGNVLVGIGVVLLVYGPVVRWYVRAEKASLQSDDDAPPAGEPQQEVAQPQVVPERVSISLIATEVPPQRVAPFNPYGPGPDKTMRCPRCGGKACDWGKYERPCPMCKATGELPGMILGFDKCKYCDGKGCDAGKYERPCQVCNGFGRRIPLDVAEKAIVDFFSARNL